MYNYNIKHHSLIFHKTTSSINITLNFLKKKKLKKNFNETKWNIQQYSF